MEHREYAVTFTIETDIRDVEQVTARLRRALDTAPLDPYFDCVDVRVEAEPFDEEECCSTGSCTDEPGHVPPSDGCCPNCCVDGCTDCARPEEE